MTFGRRHAYLRTVLRHKVDLLTGWVRFCDAAAQLRIQRHDEAAFCQRFSVDGQVQYRLLVFICSPGLSQRLSSNDAGVEMELGLTVRNHIINLNATQSFYDYVSFRVPTFVSMTLLY